MNTDLCCMICLCEINNITELCYFPTFLVFPILLVNCSTAQQKAVWHWSLSLCLALEVLWGCWSSCWELTGQETQLVWREIKTWLTYLRQLNKLVEFYNNVAKFVCLNKFYMIYYFYMFVQWYSFLRRITSFIIIFRKKSFHPPVFLGGDHFVLWWICTSCPSVIGAICICFLWQHRELAAVQTETNLM